MKNIIIGINLKNNHVLIGCDQNISSFFTKDLKDLQIIFKKLTERMSRIQNTRSDGQQICHHR